MGNFYNASNDRWCKFVKMLFVYSLFPVRNGVSDENLGIRTLRQRRLQLLIYAHSSQITSKSSKAAPPRILDDKLRARDEDTKKQFHYLVASAADIPLITFDTS